MIKTKNIENKIDTSIDSYQLEAKTKIPVNLSNNSISEIVMSTEISQKMIEKIKNIIVEIKKTDKLNFYKQIIDKEPSNILLQKAVIKLQGMTHVTLK